MSTTRCLRSTRTYSSTQVMRRTARTRHRTGTWSKDRMMTFTVMVIINSKIPTSGTLQLHLRTCHQREEQIDGTTLEQLATNQHLPSATQARLIKAFTKLSQTQAQLQLIRGQRKLDRIAIVTTTSHG